MIKKNFSSICVRVETWISFYNVIWVYFWFTLQILCAHKFLCAAECNHDNTEKSKLHCNWIWRILRSAWGHTVNHSSILNIIFYYRIHVMVITYCIKCSIYSIYVKIGIGKRFSHHIFKELVFMWLSAWKKLQSQQGQWFQKHYVLACFELKGFMYKYITAAHSCYIFNQF